MTTILIFIAAIVVLSTVVFVVVRKTDKVEAEPLGYEAAPVLEPVVKVAEKKKTAKPKTSKNTAKNASLAKMEAKPVKTRTKKK